MSIRTVIEILTRYGQCKHPAVYFRDGRAYCTECHQLRY